MHPECRVFMLKLPELPWVFYDCPFLITEINIFVIVFFESMTDEMILWAGLVFERSLATISILFFSSFFNYHIIHIGSIKRLNCNKTQYSNLFTPHETPPTHSFFFLYKFSETLWPTGAFLVSVWYFSVLTRASHLS